LNCLHNHCCRALLYASHFSPRYITDFSEDACSDNEQSADTKEQLSSALYLNEAFNSDTPLSFKRLLQHFAVYTKQKKSSMTYLLKLLIRHSPKPNYDTLPNTGKQLLYIDGRDVSTFPIPSFDHTGYIFTKQAMLSQETQTNISMTQSYQLKQ